MSTLRQQFLTQAKETFSTAFFAAFIRRCHIDDTGDGGLLVRCPNSATVQWFKKNAEKSLRALAATLPDAPKNISYRVDKSLEESPSSAKTAASSPKSSFAAAPLRRARNGLSARFSFDNFVIGKSNELALTVTRKIARSETFDTNAFVISGPTGLGKTHLVHALGNTYCKNFPDKSVLLTTGRQFMNDVISAYQSKQLDAFKSRYYSPDMLIIDDIQHIGGEKLRTQEEFFFLFNEICDHSKKIIITSDRAPAALKKTLPERIVSRLLSGLNTFITPPEFELRAGILQHKARQMHLALDGKALHFIAENIKSNVRELEGALNRIAASAAFQNITDINAEFCRKVLADLIGSGGPINPEVIIQKTAEFFHLRVADITSKKRYKNLMRPRHLAIYLCRQLTTISLPDIGKHFGNRNHSTILSSIKKIEEQQTDPDILDAIKKIEMAVKDAH